MRTGQARRGAIFITTVLFFLLSWAGVAGAAEFTVDSKGDQPDEAVGSGGCKTALGTCTLRAAIEESNATPFVENEGNIIGFEFGTFDGGIAGTIQLGSTLPTITRKVRIEGSARPTQCETDYFGTPGPCTGISGPAGGTAFRVSASGVQLIGFAVSNDKIAAEAVGGPGLWLWNDWIGLKLDGSAGPVETGAFIDQDSDGADFGGYGSLPRDIFANVTGAAINLDGADFAIVRGNGFGVMPDGATPAPNGTNILIGDAAIGENRDAKGNWIGERLDQESLASTICDGGCNVIAAAEGPGIDLEGSAPGEEPVSGSTRIFGNYIGVDAFGEPLPNETAGVLVGGSSGTTIGGRTAGDRNLIDGGTAGILAAGSAYELTVERNWIGLDPTGNAAQDPPSEAGIAIGDGRNAVVLDNRLSMLTGTALEVAVHESLIEGNVTGEGVNGARLPGGTIGVRVPNACGRCAALVDNTVLDATKYGVAVEGSGLQLRGNRIEGAGAAGINLQVPGPFGGVTGTVIGGDTAAAENTISGNGGPAIRMVENYVFGTVYNEVLRNHGSSNAGPFISLVNGADGEIAPPGIAGSGVAGASGTARPGAVIRVFRKAGSSLGELESFLAEAVADGTGAWSVAYPGAIPAGTIVAASQITDDRGSSEYAFATTTEPPAGGGGGEATQPPANPQPRQSTPGAPVPTHPQTFIVKGPARKSTSRLARFTFRSDRSQARFRCRLDSRLATNCHSPQTYRGLKLGKHVFKVWAVAADGTEDATSAMQTFWVERGPAGRRD